MTEQTNTPQTDIEKILDRVQKLMNLAANNPNENEASAAAAKAQAILTEYNLEIADVSEAKAEREKTTEAGGFYMYQRSIWYAVTGLNFCLYRIILVRTTAYRYVHDVTGAKSMRKTDENTRKKVSVFAYRNVIVGKKVNTQASLIMGEYLQTAVERLTADRPEAQDSEEWANSFRRGAAARIVQKIEEKRYATLRKEQEAQRKAEKAGGEASSSNALVLTGFIDNENDANLDFVYGAGYSAKLKADAAERARKRAEELAGMTDEERAEAEKPQKGRKSRGKTMKVNAGAYYAGHDAASTLSLSPQVGKGKTAGALK